ncbi:ABC transporter permease [Oceanibacterium hippocampi]|uniref:Transport permease protein n=1 Tax=Oceanibacterium hippocampi TaxID=745714 RepID=A0A1Y5RNN5_9PROT|nr:ABC transporter permease [Oceanibacterium hippocampi]SLN21314.1 ABC-2 type transporter [Oceanibacterium hippocampi]
MSAGAPEYTPQALRQNNPAFSAGRVLAMVSRHVYLIRSSWPRLLEMAYWPTVQMIMWGFMTQYLAGHANFFAQSFGLLLAAVLLWDVLFRGQISFSVSFFEEMWSRNLGHLFVSPLRPAEMVAALMTMSLLRTILGVVPASLLAIAFFGFSIYELGLSLAAFFFSLIMFGWAIGMVVSGLVMRFGLGAENLAWAAIFALLPISGVYYPIAILPEWVQHVSYALPSAYAFEGMRSVMIDGTVPWGLMLRGFLLNAVYLAIGAWIFSLFFQAARRRGLLLQIGE